MKLNQIAVGLIVGCLIGPSCKLQEREKKEEGRGDLTKIVYSALADFVYEAKDGTVPFYRDSLRNALAVDAVRHKDKFSNAVVQFNGDEGVYDIRFTSMGETDGESTYRIIVNGRLVGSYQNLETEVDYVLNTYTVNDVKLVKGQDAEIEFNSHSNSKIPEGDGER